MTLTTTTATIYEQDQKHKNPMTVFTYALKAPESRRQYPRRLKIFLDHLRPEGKSKEAIC
jgi:hypothetical protein